MVEVVDFYAYSFHIMNLNIFNLNEWMFMIYFWSQRRDRNDLICQGPNKTFELNWKLKLKLSRKNDSRLSSPSLTFTTSWTCSGFMNIGMARMTLLTGAGLRVLNRTGHVVAIRTYSFLRDSEYWQTNQHTVSTSFFVILLNIWIKIA